MTTSRQCTLSGKRLDREALSDKHSRELTPVDLKLIANVLFPGSIGGWPGPLPDLHLATAADNADVHGCKKDMCGSGICINGYSTTKEWAGNMHDYGYKDHR